MKTVNKVTSLSNVSCDIETRYLPSGEAVSTLAVATSLERKHRESREKQQATEWHDRIELIGG